MNAAPRASSARCIGSSTGPWTTLDIAQRSAQAAHEQRSGGVDRPARHSAPGGDQQAVAGIVRIVLGNVLAGAQAELVDEWRRLEAPVLLEAERARAALAAPVVEYARPAVGAAAHDLPVLEVVRGELARRDHV